MYFRFCGLRNFHIMEPVGQNQRRSYILSSSAGGSTGGKVAVYDYRLVKQVL